MASLSKINSRFEIPLTVVEGGSGIIMGVVTEADQKQLPVNVFINPRHVLRTSAVTAVKPGMVLRTPAGSHYIVGYNGPSDQPEGTIWQSWRLFEATDQLKWERRTKVTDTVTQLDRDGPLEDLGMIWVAVEMLARQLTDFRTSQNFEQSQIITGRPVQTDDLLGGRKVTRAVIAMGITVGALT
jgi:hypothetical protein